ncbi:MAG: tRNA dihydrouridine synthase DusB [Dysgonamonadaceae bacterium]|jgi:nifR3 family TIM-barrel protein|nr:tRNA dihydrouridine synthase DusB [Dysgonamonadaceae bacterium]
MQAGNIKFDSYPVFLAPMEDITDITFRTLCKHFGADLVYTEFISSDALIRNVSKTKTKIEISDSERPVAIQIYGREIDPMVAAAQICETAKPDIIDLNFGCPVKKIAGKGAGAGMLRTPELMLAITRAVVRAVNLPVTVKTRLGWDSDSKNIVTLAEQLQDTGIAALTIHGRTRAQMYSGEADWTLIGDVKNNPRMKIPIVGNGDLNSPQNCRDAFNRYGVDAIMIGRAAIGAPWIFKDVKQFLSTGTIPEKEAFSIYLNILKMQISQSVDRLGEQRGIIHCRRHIAASPLFKNIPDFKPTRVAMLRADSLDRLFLIMDAI